MASYAMAHLQLDLLLTETGFKPTTNQRLRVYLTNSLEESHPDTGTLFANWLSSEANEANHIKRDSPVMCIIGNPPYSGESANKGKWIMNLMEDYKKEPGGKEKLKEQNSKFINDDYVKFLRYGQHFIEKNGSGVLAYINPHGFLDNPTFRGMRWHLLKTYDKIYTIDLHGNAKKKETAPDGSSDINVFDIQQGVSINVFVKTGKKKANELGKVFHFDLFGKREMKYDFLSENTLKHIDWKELNPQIPDLFFVAKDFDLKDLYDKGFSVVDLFPINGVGICSKRDATAFQNSKIDLTNVIDDFTNLTELELKQKYLTEKDESRDKKTIYAKENILRFGFRDEYIKKVNYRPFDIKYTYYTNKSKGFLAYPVYNVLQHLTKINIGLIVPRQCASDWRYCFITNNIADLNLIGTAGSFGSGNIFPLYIYPETNGQQTIDQTTERTPNLNPEIVKQIAAQLGLTFVPDHELCHAELVSASQQTLKRVQGDKTVFTPLDILDYIYAVLHSPTYREKYKEFLKIDFPRVPYPKDAATFWQLVQLGGQIRQIHLLESPIVEKYITGYPEDGDNIVIKPKYENGKVFINDTQYFSNVPEVAWNFYIGGYQPAQKWLKDRKDRKLEFDDILHYQKIIVALSETDRLMKEIDAIEIE
jgi:predicted helicase